jgi:hypothetical protein
MVLYACFYSFAHIVVQLKPVTGVGPSFKLSVMKCNPLFALLLLCSFSGLHGQSPAASLIHNQIIVNNRPASISPASYFKMIVISEDSKFYVQEANKPVIGNQHTNFKASERYNETDDKKRIRPEKLILISWAIVQLVMLL